MFHRTKEDFYRDSRFEGIQPLELKLWLSSPTMHGDELRWVEDAIESNWVTTLGANVDAVEKGIAEKTGRAYAVGLSSGTAALHMAVRLAGERLYGAGSANRGVLDGKRVFCTDMTFDATVNPVAYEGGEAVFIDTERDSWNMDPEALERAFRLFPDTKLVVYAHLYGTPGRADEICKIAKEHGAVVVEDAAESLGATFKGVQTGKFGDYSVVSFNGNKIITGSSGGVFLADEAEDADAVRKWSTQARERAPWYQHVELGYNYRMSNIVAGVVRGQIPYLEEHISQKREIYERYKEGLKNLPVVMNPIPGDCEANYWLSCLTINQEAMCVQARSDEKAVYDTEKGKSCPTEILNALTAYNAEGRPIWKPMHMQPIYAEHPFVGKNGSVRGRKEAPNTGDAAAGICTDVGADIFERGLCLPSDNKMTPQMQDVVIEIVKRCFL